jgi:hypothetical protein
MERQEQNIREENLMQKESSSGTENYLLDEDNPALTLPSRNVVDNKESISVKESTNDPSPAPIPPDQEPIPKQVRADDDVESFSDDEQEVIAAV